MDERSKDQPSTGGEPRPAASRERHPSEVRRLFDEAAPLDPAARDRLLASCSATEAVVAEVRELLAVVPDEARIDPWRDDHRVGRLLTGPRGRWRLDAVIGEGGAGRVYRAEELDRRRPAAIKVIDAGRGTPERLARVADELRALESIDHPGIVQVLDADLDACTADAREPWIAMEFIDGGRTITEHALDLAPSDRSMESILDLFEQALEIVAAVHESGIVHRDLKPSNLLVDASGRVRLIDFGVARLLGAHAEGPTLSIDRTREGDLVGTPAYMAPEQVDATLGPISTATDVHALGVLAYRLLTGRLPYAIGESLLSAAQAIRFVPPRDLRVLAPEVTAPVATVLEVCLAKEPGERPATAGIALDMLRAARVDARDSSPQRLTGHVTGGNHGTRVAVAVIVVTAAIIAAMAAITSLDPIVESGTTDDPGAGVQEMKFRPMLGAVIGGALMSGSVRAQDAVQWRIEDGGNGHWYAAIELVPGGNWPTARKIVSAFGGDLASLETAAEQQWIAESGLAGTITHWIGLFQEPGSCEPDCGWNWVSGAPLTVSSWAAGEPNNQGGPYGPENHALLLGEEWGCAPSCALLWADWPGSTTLTAASAIIEWSADCNDDGIVDYGQILEGTFDDTNGNGVPDCCDVGDDCDDYLDVPGEYPTIQAAVDACPDGGTIRLADGEYPESVVIPARDIRILGDPTQPATRRIVGCCDQDTITAITPSNSWLTLEGISIVNSPAIGVFINRSHLRMLDCVVTGSSGRGVELSEYVEGVFRRTVFSENTGGLYAYVSSNIDAEDCDFTGNVRSSYGAGIGFHVGSSGSIRSCRFEDNRSPTGQGNDVGLSFSGSRVFADCTFVRGNGVEGPVWWSEFGGSASCSNGTFCGSSMSDINGGFNDAGGNEFFPTGCAPPCPGDITDNRQVDAADLGILLAVWNTAGKSNPEADINGDGTVNAADLGLLLGNWGPCPE